MDTEGQGSIRLESWGALMTPSADLIPLRALNQVSYCRRLYYLEYVEGLMPINEHVEAGLFQHRRVNDPELAGRSRAEGDAVHTRSVSLSSERLGLTGKLDLVEEKDGQCYPVEYKRSAGPKSDPGYWDNDALQVCGQGMLLEEELGRPIVKGILYYAGSKRRVEVPLDEALRAKTLAAIADIRRLQEREAPPEPLAAELRHRCHGCSLLTICQPEETLYLLRQAPLAAVAETQHAEGADYTPARVLPPTDEGAVLYLQEQGSFVGKRSEHLVVQKDGHEAQRTPICSVRQVVVFGNVQVSTQALEALAVREVPVVYLTRYGRFIAALEPAPTKNVMLRADQYRVFSDPARAMVLSRAVVKAKIANQRTLLMRSLRSLRNQESGIGGQESEISHETSQVLKTAEVRTESGVDSDDLSPPSSLTSRPSPLVPRASDEPAVCGLADLLGRVDAIVDPAVLLGTEGQAAHLYFSQFGRMLKSSGPGRAFDFSTRNRRPPRDPVNALLSFAYALLAKDCFAAVLTVGFDPYQGFFHAGRYGRPSLALDLMEEFRPVIADSVVLTLINNAMLAPDDFLTWREACQLTEAGRKQFFRAYEQRKATIVKHPMFDYPMSYSRMLEVQARVLAGHVRGDIPQYVGFTVR